MSVEYRLFLFLDQFGIAIVGEIWPVFGFLFWAHRLVCLSVWKFVESVLEEVVIEGVIGSAIVIQVHQLLLQKSPPSM